LFIERLQASLFTAAAAGALLQRRLPTSGLALAPLARESAL
jgi:hypothetical protein